MSENDFFRKKLRDKGYDTFEDARRSSKSDLTKETYSGILGRDKRADLRTLLHLSIDFGCSNKELSELLSARGEPKIAQLLNPATITPHEQDLLAKMRKLEPAKRKLVEDMVKSLGG